MADSVVCKGQATSPQALSGVQVYLSGSIFVLIPAVLAWSQIWFNSQCAVHRGCAHAGLGKNLTACFC